MRRSIASCTPLAFSFVLALFLFQCAPPADSGGGGAISEGGGTSDTIGSPEGTSGRPVQPYAAAKNLIAPAKHEFFEFYTRQMPFPFNAEAVKSRGIRSAEVRQYTSADNDFLEENTAEAELELSRRFRFRFDAEGRVNHFERLALVVGDPLDSARMEFTYAGDGALEAVFGVSVLGPIDGKADFADGHIREWNEPASLSVSYRYDEENDRLYETRYTRDGNAVVVVKANADLTETALEELADDVLARESPFVNYTVAPQLRQVFVEVAQAGQLLVTYEMDGRGRLDGIHRYEYGNESLVNDRYTEQGESGRQTQRHFHYSDFGDLKKVVFNEVDPGQTGLSSTHHFFYDDFGRWTKRVFSSNLLTGNTAVERVDFVSYGN